MEKPVDMHPPIILGSSSSARKMLFERLLLPFTCCSPDIDEMELPNETPLQLVKRLTKQKSQKIAENLTDALVISADQVIVVNGSPISKPESYEQAVKQLRAESGQWVEALGGLGVLNVSTQQYQYTCVKTKVLFQSLTDERIHQYLTQDPQAIYCAGSLRVEALGISLLEKVSSEDPTALIGLPLIALCAMLRKEGVNV